MVERTANICARRAETVLQRAEAARDDGRTQARPAFASVGVWKYWLSSENCSISRRSSAMRPSAVLIGRHSSQRGSPQGCRE